MLTYGIIKGEKTLNKYCEKRWGQRPRFMETIGHIANVTIEHFYEHGPDDDGYAPYYLLIMEHEKGKFTSFNDIREEAYEAIRTGKARLLTA